MQFRIPGIHHITAIASDPQKNIDFYSKVLGQRLVKKTVNFDDPGTYHLYFADATGTPGTVLTFFPWPTARRGQPGAGEVVATAYTIPRNSLAYWQQRLSEFSVSTGEMQTRFGEPVLPFQDPDGMKIELVASEALPDVVEWGEGPIPIEHTLRGFHSATLCVTADGKSTALLTDILGYTRSGQEGDRCRYQSEAGTLGSYLDLLVLPNQMPGRMGAGTVHHIAFRTENDAVQDTWRRKLDAHGFSVTPMQDRQYFHSIYFREPSGVLYEIATNPPGFLWDEEEAELGTTVKLPPWLEPKRAQIERVLPVLE